MDHCAHLSRPAHHPTGGLARRLLRRMACMAELRRQRRALGRLGAHELADIGLARTEAAREAARPAWDAPDHWHLRDDA
ncbi:MAG: DUF1127 domain-containing protein [Proteobacteria bacterium]|nr:DUF1127 domain-containing protein [Pseudomonadota bacterium]MBS0572909.1 DUF1127 domain-containing protein [Pseudomonadota bacterium]